MRGHLALHRLRELHERGGCVEPGVPRVHREGERRAASRQVRDRLIQGAEHELVRGVTRDEWREIRGILTDLDDCAQRVVRLDDVEYHQRFDRLREAERSRLGRRGQGAVLDRVLEVEHVAQRLVLAGPWCNGKAGGIELLHAVHHVPDDRVRGRTTFRWLELVALPSDGALPGDHARAQVALVGKQTSGQELE